MGDTKTSQLDLFAASAPPASRRSPERERLEREHMEAAAIAGRLPENVFFGTSSWSFPDWAGIVYSRHATTSQLSREGLAEYARHPLLTTVGIDRGYYAPIPPQDLVRYAEQLPPGFPCCAKAPEEVTSADRSARSGGTRGEANPAFLNAALFEDNVLGVFREVFRDHAGPFILQFPPSPRSLHAAPAAFAERLDRFLRDLPEDFRYAVELRDPELLTREYGQVLAAHGVAHVFNYVTAMPMPAEQAATIPVESAPFAMVRLLLPPGTYYGERGQALKPFARISDPDPGMRDQVVSLALRAIDVAIPVFVLVNNKAEGCAPLTIRALAEKLADELGR